LRLKLLFRNQIYDTDLCFLLIIINKERWRILSKLYFGLQFPHFPTWLCKKKRAARPGDLSSSPSIDTLQALRLEMTEDYYYDLPDRRMCSERRGVLIWPWRMKTWATETKRGLLGVSTNIKDEAEIWWGKTNNKHHQEWGYTLRSFKLTGKLEHCLIAGHEWIPARDSFFRRQMDPDGWIPQVARWNPLKRRKVPHIGPHFLRLWKCSVLCTSFLYFIFFRISFKYMLTQRSLITYSSKHVGLIII
jgi:hypothetical protein